MRADPNVPNAHAIEDVEDSKEKENKAVQSATNSTPAVTELYADWNGINLDPLGIIDSSLIDVDDVFSKAETSFPRLGNQSLDGVSSTSVPQSEDITDDEENTGEEINIRQNELTSTDIGSQLVNSNLAISFLPMPVLIPTPVPVFVPYPIYPNFSLANYPHAVFFPPRVVDPNLTIFSSPTVPSAPTVANLEKKRPATESSNIKGSKRKKSNYNKKKNEYGVTPAYWKEAEELCKKENPNWHGLPIERKRQLLIAKSQHIKAEINEQHEKKVQAYSKKT